MSRAGYSNAQRTEPSSTAELCLVKRPNRSNSVQLGTPVFSSVFSSGLNPPQNIRLPSNGMG